MLRKIKNIFKKQEESYVKVPFDELEVGDVFRLESSQFDHEEQIRVGCEDMYNYIWAYNHCFRTLMVMGFNENGDIEIRDSPIHMVGIHLSEEGLKRFSSIYKLSKKTFDSSSLVISRLTSSA